MISFEQILAAKKRLEPYVKQTPVVESSLLNKWLGSRILFKAECLQTIGAFKIRGAINTLAKLSENNALPERVVANSSGNHAQAVAYAASLFNLPCKIFTTQNVSEVKAAATEYYGAELERFPTRVECDNAVQIAAKEPGVLWIPPYNHPDVICGQGTLLLDAIDLVGDVDAVVAPCGGGGLLSGSLITARKLCPKAKVLGAEPLAANDAANSLRKGEIVALDGPAVTLADGAATPAVGSHTFPLLQQLDGFYEVDETAIAYWTQWLQHLLKLHLEPTSAMSMQAVKEWLKTQDTGKKVLVLISGGNIDANKMRQIWQQDHLTKIPGLS